MKNLQLFIWAVLCLSLGLLGSMGCGGGETVILTISPTGPTIVLKGNTLQFTSNIAGTTFSVVGGDANGTINATTGLYTPPTTLPIDPQITVMGTFEGQTDSALVDLRTGNTMSFGAAEQVNDNPIPGSPYGFLELVFPGLADRIDVRLNSIHVDSVWNGPNPTPTPTPPADIFFNQNVNFAGFGMDSNLTNDSSVFQFPNSIVLDSMANPGIIFMEVTPPISFPSAFDSRLRFLGSSNQGGTFPIERAIDESDPNSAQVQGASRIDGQDNIHVAFIDAATDFNTDPLIKYARSNDGGSTWNPAVFVGTPNPASMQTFPQVAVDPAGNNVFVCWTDDRGMGSGTSDIFFATSTNGGLSFNSPVPITSTGNATTCRVARGPNGEIYISYEEEGSDSDSFEDIFVVKSTDGGTSFGSPVQVNTNPTNLPSNIFPFMSVDSLGRIDAVWIADESPDASSELILRYGRSTDGGATFSPDIQIAGGGMTQLVFIMGLRHDESGRLHLQYFDDVNDPATNYDIFYMMAE